MGHGPGDHLFLELDENGGGLRHPDRDGQIAFFLVVGQNDHGDL